MRVVAVFQRSCPGSHFALRFPMAEPSLKPMTVDDFLRWEEEQPEAPRFELVDGVPHMMAPERIRHTDVKGAVFVALGRALARLEGSGCRVFTEGITVPIQDHSSYKPDISVYCGEPLDDNTTVLENPVIIVEVLSPSTASFDRGAKLIGYFSLDSVAHYLLIDPDLKTVEHHQRRGNQIIKNTLTGGTLALDPPGLDVDVADLFETRWEPFH